MHNSKNFKMGENDFGAKDLDAINGLIKQLNPNALPLEMSDVIFVMSCNLIISMRDVSKGDLLIGMGTLVPIRKLFSYCGTIEDVIVDENYRKMGLGKKIISVLIRKSRLLGMKFVDLTSRPERTAANELYKSIGFRKRETNLYRLNNSNIKGGLL